MDGVHFSESMPDRDLELTWLYSIAFRVLSNYRRARDRRSRLESRLANERDFEEGDKDNDTSEIGTLLAELNRLEVVDRQILEFFYWESLSYHEIAVILEISENAVGLRLHKAKKRLKNSLVTRDVLSIEITAISSDVET